MSSREEVEKATRKKAALFAAVFDSSAGKKVLEYLNAEFNQDELRASTPHDTYYRLGQRDVVVYINQMIKYSGATNETED